MTTSITLNPGTYSRLMANTILPKGLTPSKDLTISKATILHSSDVFLDDTVWHSKRPLPFDILLSEELNFGGDITFTRINSSATVIRQLFVICVVVLGLSITWAILFIWPTLNSGIAWISSVFYMLGSSCILVGLTQEKSIKKIFNWGMIIGGILIAVGILYTVIAYSVKLPNLPWQASILLLLSVFVLVFIIVLVFVYFKTNSKPIL